MCENALTNHVLRDHLEFKKAFFAKRKPNFKDTLAINAPRTYPWWNELSVERKARPEGWKPPFKL
jgi:hypothetical protein